MWWRTELNIKVLDALLFNTVMKIKCKMVLKLQKTRKVYSQKILQSKLVHRRYGSCTEERETLERLSGWKYVLTEPKLWRKVVTVAFCTCHKTNFKSAHTQINSIVIWVNEFLSLFWRQCHIFTTAWLLLTSYLSN